jgi:hypothetical protein
LLELLAAGRSIEEIQADLPFIESEDVRQALGCAATLAHRGMADWRCLHPLSQSWTRPKKIPEESATSVGGATRAM